MAPLKNSLSPSTVVFCDFPRFSGIFYGNMNFTPFCTRIPKIGLFFSSPQYLLSYEHIQKPEVNKKTQWIKEISFWHIKQMNFVSNLIKVDYHVKITLKLQCKAVLEVICSIFNLLSCMLHEKHKSHTCIQTRTSISI